MAQPRIPSEWNGCTWAQLTEIYRIIGEKKGDRLERNLALWLMLSGMEIVEGEGEILDKGEYLFYFRRKDQKVTKTITKNSINHKTPTINHQEDEEWFSARADDMALYLMGSRINDNDNHKQRIDDKLRKKYDRPGILDWVDNMVGHNGDGGLTMLPIETISIGGKEWRLPSALITSITYEQYTNAQQLQQAIWGLTEEVQRRMKELEQRHQLDENSLEDIKQLTNELSHYRARMLSHMLLPAEKGAEYKSEDAEERTDFFLQHIDDHPHLLDILIQHLQSCLGVYKTQFPDLFSGDGSGSDVIPMVSEVNTINAIMKWQGYQEQQKVFDSNAIFIFSILNSMTKEAKAIEESNAKMKRHK